MFLGNIVNEVDSRLVKLARVQPVIQHPKLIGEPIKLMSDSLEVSNTQLANKAMAQVGAYFSTAALPRGGGNHSTRGSIRKLQGKRTYLSRPRKSEPHIDTNREDKRRHDSSKSLNEHKESYQSYRGRGSLGSRGSRGSRGDRGSNRGAGRGSDRRGNRGSFKR